MDGVEGKTEFLTKGNFCGIQRVNYLEPYKLLPHNSMACQVATQVSLIF